MQFFWRLLRRPLTSQRQASRQVCARLERQWIHVLRQYFVDYGRISSFSTCKWYSDPEVYVLLSTCSWRSVHSGCFSFVFSFGKFACFYEPLVLCSHPGFQRIFLKPSMTKSSSSSRARGWESCLPGDPPSIGLRDSLQRRCSLWPYTSII